MKNIWLRETQCYFITCHSCNDHLSFKYIQTRCMIMLEHRLYTCVVQFLWLPEKLSSLQDSLDLNIGPLPRVIDNHSRKVLQIWVCLELVVVVHWEAMPRLVVQTDQPENKKYNEIEISMTIKIVVIWLGSSKVK